MKCTLCNANIELAGPVIIGEDPRLHAAHLAQRAAEHVVRGHPAEFQKLQHGASQYLTVLILGCFEIDDQVLKQDAATARDFAHRTLNPEPVPAVSPLSSERV